MNNDEVKKPDSRTKQYALEKRKAMRARQVAIALQETDPYGAHLNRLVAGDHDEKAANHLVMTEEPEIQHGEVVPKGVDNNTWMIRDTLKHPDVPATDASVERTDLLLKSSFNLAGMGIDAAESIGAQNSLEKMLAHQLALAHKASFELSDKALSLMHKVGNPFEKLQTQQFASTEATRLLNAATRLMNTYQQGLLTIQKIRNGGKQTVTVQHVNVGAGGQAVIGNVQTGGGDPEGQGKKNG